nr:metallophosphoesterase [Candidatus Woesearchaeota archaeon]
MKIFITADHHFHHKNIIEYCKRPFKTVEEMDNIMTEKWNKKVGKDDLVIHLGDFALGNKEKVKETREKLNGTIVLIKGNHDRVNEGFIVVRDSIQIGNLLFSHRPIPKGEVQKGCINVHGHIHEKESLSGINVSVEKTDYEPIPLEELEKKINERASMKKDKKVEMGV